MSTQLEQAARQALEALESKHIVNFDVNGGQVLDQAITALRAALEQPAQDEPVYFCDYGYEGWGKVDAAMAAENIACGMTVEAYYTRPQQPAQDEPVGTYHGSNDFGHDIVDLDKVIPVGTKLYTHPQACKPLTEVQIATVYWGATGQSLRPQDNVLAHKFARAIEAAHGIGEKK